MPYGSVELAVKEAHHAAKMGLKGLELSCSWDIEPMRHPSWEPATVVPMLTPYAFPVLASFTRIVEGAPAGGGRCGHRPERWSLIRSVVVQSLADHSIEEPKHTTTTMRQTSQAPITSRMPTVKASG